MRGWALIAILLAALVLPASADSPSRQPVLLIEPGMHTAQIWRAGEDGSGRWLVTSSFDKTLRIWDTSRARPVAVLRPPVGPADAGLNYGVAMSPDASLVACGSLDWQRHAAVYMFERSSGRVLREIDGLPSVPIDLAFSRKGEWLAVGCAGNGGLRLLHTRDGSVAAQDLDYRAEISGVDFSADGSRMVTASHDGALRLYAVPGFKLLAKQPVAGGNQPHCARFSPDSRSIAVGFEDSGNVTVLSADGLKVVAAYPNPDVRQNLHSVCWSSDGRQLYAGGSFMKEGGYFIRCWEGGRSRDALASGFIIRDLRARRGGGVISVSSDPAVAFFDASVKRLSYHAAPFISFYFAFRGLQINHDGTAIQYPLELFGKRPARFGVDTRTITVGAAPVGPLPRTTAPGIAFAKWDDVNNPLLNGRSIGVTEGCRSLAIAPDGRQFVLGTDSFVRCFDARGASRWARPLIAAAWSVHVSGDGRLALATLADGTIRWYRMRDGQELLAFYPAPDERRWILWTPSGYYDCSVGGEDLVGWLLNRGAAQAADFFPASRFHGSFYRPDVIDRILGTLDEGEALRQANQVAGQHGAPPTVESHLPPVVRILSPADGATVSGAQATVRYTVRTPTSEPVSGLKVLVDGRPVEGRRDLSVVARDDLEKTMTVNLPAHDCTISIIASNRFAASEAATVRLTRTAAPPSSGGFDARPTLYVLAVGVARYPRAEWELRYPAKDARDFCNVMVRQKGALYRDVVVKQLTDKEATRDNILDGLDWVRKQTTSRDVAMVYLSGHGVSDTDGSYYFVPFDFDVEKVLRTGVSGADIRKTLATVAGKAIFLFDSCHAGAVMPKGTRGLEPAGIINELVSAENGTVVMASSTGRQVSLEDEAWGNGAFTKALVEGLEGKADFSHTGRVTVNMLDLYICERVKALTGGRQSPTSARPATVPDFPVAMVK